MKYITKVLLFVSLYFLFTINNTYASEKRSGISNFPDSYKPYLQEIQKTHPNWAFTALYTGLDWKTVIDNEDIFGKNLVPKNYSDDWKNTKTGEYNVEVDSGWVDASRKAVEYAMDPRNFLYEGRIFQFETLSYNSKTNNLDAIEKILYGTEFYNRIVEYRTSTGTNVVTNKKYSDFILDAAITSKVSEYHLASRIKQEVGPFLSHSSISGTLSGYEGYYNFYNIGATSSAEPLGAIKNGLQYAKDGRGVSQATKDKYLIPWNTKQRAITGGGIFIGSSYINIGQNTIYLQKFDVNDEKAGELFWHQYMTNVLAPYSESKIIQTGYSNGGLLDLPMSFIIPVYNNMPDISTDSPDIKSKDFTDDNTRVKSNVNALNIRTGPGTSYDVITQVNSGYTMTRVKRGKQSGDLWDKVVLDSGIIGYVFQSYLSEIPNIQIADIEINISQNTINKNESIKLEAKAIPENSGRLIYKSSNTSVALVDNVGNILGVSSGNCNVIVASEDGKVSKTIPITVYSPVTDVYINSDNMRLRERETFTISAIIEPDDASNKNVSWESSNTEVAIIDANGNIEALKEGQTTIKVKTQDGSKEKSIELTIVKNLLGTEIVFYPELTVLGSEVTGIDYKDNTVRKYKKTYKYRIYYRNLQ